MRPGPAWLGDEGGAAALEFALWLMLLTPPLLSVIDTGLYVHRRMQVEEAAQVAAQMVWETCDTPAKLPATDVGHCPALTTPVDRVTAAAQSTSLGPLVSVTSVTEGYYCVNGAAALELVATPPTAPPADCLAVGGSSAAPGDYVLTTVSYVYTPLFAGVSVGSAFTTPIVRTAWMRLN